MSLTSLVTQKAAQLYQMPLIFGNTPPVDHSQNSNSKCQSNSKCRCLLEAVAREFPIKHKAKHGTGFLEEFYNLHLWRFSKFKWMWPWVIFSTFQNSLPFNKRLDQLMFKFPSKLCYDSMLLPGEKAVIHHCSWKTLVFSYGKLCSCSKGSHLIYTK